jgi:hypothetical protein
MDGNATFAIAIGMFATAETTINVMRTTFAFAGAEDSAATATGGAETGAIVCAVVLMSSFSFVVILFFALVGCAVVPLWHTFAIARFLHSNARFLIKPLHLYEWQTQVVKVIQHTHQHGLINHFAGQRCNRMLFLIELRSDRHALYKARQTFTHDAPDCDAIHLSGRHSQATKTLFQSFPAN